MENKVSNLEKYLEFTIYLTVFGFAVLMTYLAFIDESTPWDTFFVLFSILIVDVFMAYHYLRRNQKKP